MKHCVTISFFVLLLGLAITHYLALSWYLYWMYPWFDVPIHFWGGVVVALGTQIPLFASMTRIRATALVRVIPIVLIVGMAWEVFEWEFVITDMTHYVGDTMLDVLMDLCGGIGGYYGARLLQAKIEL